MDSHAQWIGGLLDPQAGARQIANPIQDGEKWSHGQVMDFMTQFAEQGRALSAPEAWAFEALLGAQERGYSHEG